MREIKFRGMGINGDWYYGYLSESQNVGTQPEKGFYISNSVGMPWAYNVRPEAVGQYTGLKDCKGVEIYEGDIVTAKTNKNPTLDLLGKVFFDDGEYLIEQEQYDFPVCSFAVIDRLSFEVIGNIHQHPELLEGEES